MNELHIYPDEQRGHIAYRQEHDGNDWRDMNGVDVGSASPTLHFGGGWLHLSPAQAREVADSLHWWADRYEPKAMEPRPQPERCSRCGGRGGRHGSVHVRHGNGGGHNEPCPQVSHRDEVAG